jgi:hypothetical protein
MDKILKLVPLKREPLSPREAAELDAYGSIGGQLCIPGRIAALLCRERAFGREKPSRWTLPRSYL